MGSTGTETPTPTASVAKVMTAYVFLKDHPIKAGEDGPTYTISPEEAARLRERIARDESHINVTANEPFTERQALEALLVVSANNIAHEMARWDAGGDQPFVAKMNATARKLGMTHTTYTDPSGYDSSTVSTAIDQVKLLRAAMTLPGFVDAASQPTFSVPQGTDPPRRSTNALLGVDGVVAGKTGFTSAAGGNFVFAARTTVNGVTVLIVGAVMNQSGVPSSEPTVASAKPLIEAAEQALVSAQMAAKNERIGDVEDRLGGRTPLVASDLITVVGWPGLTVRLALHPEARIPHQAQSGTQLGTLGLGSGSDAPQVPVVLGTDLGSPTIAHRIGRLS
jgi:D-alanyl-D-alanine carboxypeptidase